MERDSSGGELLAAGAAAVLVSGAALPWAVPESGGAPSWGFTVAPGTVAVVLALGLALALLAWRKPSWLGLAGMAAAFVAALAMLNVSVGLHASNAVPGFGVFVVFSGSVLAIAAAIVGSIEQDMSGDEAVV